MADPIDVVVGRLAARATGTRQRRRADAEATDGGSKARKAAQVGARGCSMSAPATTMPTGISVRCSTSNAGTRHNPKGRVTVGL